MNLINKFDYKNPHFGPICECVDVIDFFKYEFRDTKSTNQTCLTFVPRIMLFLSNRRKYWMLYRIRYIVADLPHPTQ